MSSPQQSKGRRLLALALVVMAVPLFVGGLLLLVQPVPEPECAFRAEGCSPSEIADYEGFRQERADGYVTGAVAVAGAAVCAIGVVLLANRPAGPSNGVPAID